MHKRTFISTPKTVESWWSSADGSRKMEVTIKTTVSEMLGRIVFQRRGNKSQINYNKPAL